MNFKRIIGIALALVMTLALVPAVSIAANVTANEAQRLGLLDEVWNSLEAVEAGRLWQTVQSPLKLRLPYTVRRCRTV